MNNVSRAFPVAALAALVAFQSPVLAADGKTQPDPYALPAAKRALPPASHPVPDPPAPAKRISAPKKGEAAQKTDPAATASQSSTETWTEAEIAEAKSRCDVLLKGVDYVALPEPPMRHGACGAPAPLQLISIGKNPEVTFSPPPTLTCEMVKALDDWMKGDMQKLARTYLGSPVIRIETMSSYSCRNAYGRARTRLSEHGLANAIDIGGFVTQTALTTRVLGSWGLTQREIRAREIAAAKAAEEKAKADRAAAEAAAKSRRDGQRPTESGGSSAGGPASGSGIDIRLPRPNPGPDGFAISPSRLGGPGDKSAPAPAGKSASAPAAPAVKPEPVPREQKFLRAAHATACRYFGTVLGPEANFAHQNHFHFDMAPRRSGNFCE